MGSVTPTQSLRYDVVTDVISHLASKNLADDIAVQLDAADVLRTAALKRPIARARRAAALAIADNTSVVVPFDVKDWDTHGMIDLVAQPTRITCGALAGIGIYYVTARCSNLGGPVSAQQNIAISRNGVARHAVSEYGNAVGDLFAAGDVPLTATTDFLTCTLYHQGGGSVNMSGIILTATKIANL